MLPSKFLQFNYQGCNEKITQKGSANKETIQGLTMSLKFKVIKQRDDARHCEIQTTILCHGLTEKNCELSLVSCLFNCTSWLSKIVAWNWSTWNIKTAIYSSKLCHFSLTLRKPRFKRYLHLTQLQEKKRKLK
jgi:hypothetical protein